MEHLVIVALVLGLSKCAYLPEQTGAPTFRSDYTFHAEANVYLKFQEIPANFSQAHLRCHLEGTTLASPINYKLEAALRKLMESTKPLKGLLTSNQNTFSTGDFFSLEGVTLSEISHQWAKNEPNNLHNNESCIKLDIDGLLSDVNCEEPLPYVCYKKAGDDYELNECGTVDDEYQLDRLTGKCYKFHTLSNTWPRAYMTCAAEGGHLAIINSETEARVIQSIYIEYHGKIIRAANPNFALIGFHYWSERAEWMTIEGDSTKDAGYNMWKKNEPNNILNKKELCGSVSVRRALNNIYCDKLYPFICEKNPKMATNF